MTKKDIIKKHMTRVSTESYGLCVAVGVVVGIIVGVLIGLEIGSSTTLVIPLGDGVRA
jgi:TctA family transporter